MRGEERADDVAHAVEQTEHIIDLTVEHKDREREWSGDENHEILDDVCRNDVHTHRPQRDGEYQIADADVDVAAIEADEQKPQVVQRLDVDIVALADFDAVVEDDVEQNHQQDCTETDFEDRFVDVRSHERAGDVADDDGYGEQQSVPDVEHTLAQERDGRGEVLEQHGDAVRAVCHVNRQPESHKHSHCNHRAATCQRIDHADDNARHDKHYYDIPIHNPNLLVQIYGFARYFATASAEICCKIAYCANCFVLLSHNLRRGTPMPVFGARKP